MPELIDEWSVAARRNVIRGGGKPASLASRGQFVRPKAGAKEPAEGEPWRTPEKQILITLARRTELRVTVESITARECKSLKHE